MFWKKQKLFCKKQAAINEVFYFQDLSLNVHSFLDLNVSNSSFGNHWRYQRYHELLGQKTSSFIWCMHEFEWYKSDLLKWAEKKLSKKDQIMTEKYLQKGSNLEMLQAAIIFQRFPCIWKLILQEHFRRHIQKYVFFVWCNRT